MEVAGKSGKKKEKQLFFLPSSHALGELARGRRRRHRLLGLPGGDAGGGLLDRLRRRHEHRVDEVDDRGARGDVGGGDLGDRARVGLDLDDAGGGEVDGEVGLGQPRLNRGAVGELGGLLMFFYRFLLLLVLFLSP